MNFPHDNSTLQDFLKAHHKNDRDQLDFILAGDHPGVLVQAPAGYGKTRSIVSRVAYLLASGMVTWPKRILVMTFSVNASYKIKRDVAEQLPELLHNTGYNDKLFLEQVYVSNYHGLSRAILRRKGHLIDTAFASIDEFESIDGSKVEDLSDRGLNLDEAQFATDFCLAVRNADRTYVERNIHSYNELILKRLVPKKIITYNAILSFCIDLFQKHTAIAAFYQQYFASVLIDEAQDTNCLSWSLIDKIVAGQQLAFIGDPLQRIYGFIGALPNVMEEALRKYGLRIIVFKENYRFRNNAGMLALDINLRANAQNLSIPSVRTAALVDFHLASNQEAEARFICSHVRSLLSDHPEATISVLFRAGFANANTRLIVAQLEDERIDYFFALYSDEDKEYKAFHVEALKFYRRTHSRGVLLSRRTAGKIITSLKRRYDDVIEPITKSLLRLLEVLFHRLIDGDMRGLRPDEKQDLVVETLENYALKQQIAQVETKVTVTTVHGAKGLEWDYVLIPDMEQYSFPTYPAYCGGCKLRDTCKLEFDSNEDSQYLEEFSVFYVAATRARQKVLFSSSSVRITTRGTEQPINVSCLLQRPGIILNRI